MFDHKSHNSDYEFIKNLFFSRSMMGQGYSMLF